MQKIVLLFCAAVLLASCATYDGRSLKVGESGMDEVFATMGTPALQWRDADGSVQLAYPRGPAGLHTYMVRLGPNGKLLSLENVLDDKHLALVRPGMSKEEVLRILGPSDERETVYFERRDELVWDWRYRSFFGDPWRMMVLFDATSGKVRSTMVQPERQINFFPASVP